MQKILFLRTAWMKKYNGITESDKPERGGKFIEENGWGGEIFNFEPNDGKMYGYVSLSGENKRINIARIGAKRGSSYIDNVTVVWVATSENGGVFVVACYKNARVFSEVQNPDITGVDRYYKGENINYRVEADVKDCFLISEEKRTFKIDGFGHSNLWYAENEDDEFFNKVINYLKSQGKAVNPNTPSGRKKIDVYRKKMVEEKAVELTEKHFRSLGFDIKSVEKDNLGWDLNAIKEGKVIYNIEVKGLSQSEINIQLTPNEYSKMNEKSNNYKICVVTNALSQPKLSVFSYSEKCKKWKDEERKTLDVETRTGAIMRVKEEI
ncbi:MAG TPA: DUF3883 domain-containing protein [bacterium]|nr:DUF3883 domain-containing protein [bacterium]